MAEQKDYITYVHEVYDYLHTIPELGFEEYKTSAFILSELKKCGFRDEDIVSGIAGTGIHVDMMDTFPCCWLLQEKLRTEDW